MKEFRTALHYSGITLKDEARSIGTYFFLLIIFLVVQYLCPGSSDYLKQGNIRVNLWEMYILSMSTRQSQLLYLVCMLVACCQTVWPNGVMAYYLVRMKRRIWIKAQMLSLFFNIVGVNLFLLFSFAAACGGQIMFGGEWSHAAVLGAQFDVTVIGLQPIFRVPAGLLSFDPNTIGMLSLLLAVLLGMLMGLVMMIFTLAERTIYGGLLIFSLWFMEVLAVSEPMFQCLQYVLPFGLARVSYTTLNYGIVSPMYCVTFLFLVILILLWLSEVLCDKVDFVKMG